MRLGIFFSFSTVWGGAGCADEKRPCPIGTVRAPSGECVRDEDAGDVVCESDAECDIDANPCTVDRCVSGVCETSPDGLDADEDGFVSTACGGDDCEDTNPIVPIEGEICNGVDDDCDTIVDEGLYVAGTDVQISDDFAVNVSLARVHEGAGYGVLWVRDTTWEIVFQLLDEDGAPLGDAQPLSGVRKRTDVPGHVALVGVPGGFVAGWGQEGLVQHAFISLESGPEFPGFIESLGKTEARHVDAAYSGAVLGLAWIGIDSFYWPTWAILELDGTIVSGPTREENTTPPTVRIEWLGDRFGLLFETPEAGNILLLDETGTVLGSGAFTDGTAATPAAVREGDLVHVVWSDRKALAVYHRVLGADGARVSNELVIGPGGYSADVAGDGAGVLAAWIVGDGDYWGELQARVIGAGLEADPVADAVILPADDRADLYTPPSVVAGPDRGFGIAFGAQSGGVFFDRIVCE